MSSNTTRRTVPRAKADFDQGRTRSRKGIYGKVAGRANVCFGEQDWAYIRFLADACDVSLSDIIREAVTEARENLELETFEPGDNLPWGGKMGKG